MPTQEEIINQEELLKTYRRTLTHLCKQAARYGGESAVPPNVANDIYDARLNIQQIKASLRSWQHPVEDLPEDQGLTADITSASAPQQVRQGLLGLIGLLHTPQVYTATITFRADFEAACDHIKVMHYYKRLHDLFQDLEANYYVIDSARKQLTDDAGTWNNVGLHEPEVLGTIEDLLNTVSPSMFVTESAWWTQPLSQARDDLHSAVDMMNAILLLTALRRLYRVITLAPSQINTRLVAEVDALRLHVLISAMTTVRDSISLSASTAMATQQFSLSINALTQLKTDLLSLVSHHQFWQNIDDELRRVEINLVQDVNEFVLAWPDIKALAIRLCDKNTGDWVVAFQKLGVDLETALGIRASDKIMRLFRQYRSSASRRFRHVDHELVEMCNELQKIGYALSVLVKALE